MERQSRMRQRISVVTEEINNSILQNEDYLRHVKEVAIETGLPEGAVSLVLSNFFLKIPRVIYGMRFHNKRILFFGFFTLNIKKVKKFINKNLKS